MTTATRTAQSTETLTRRTADGTILALSSAGGVEYRVSLSPASCQCVGFSYRQTCRHLVAAQQRYSEPAGCPVCARSPLGICPSCAPQTVTVGRAVDATVPYENDLW